MKPAPFAYRAPDSLDEALHLLAQHGDESKVLAGGQSLVPMMSFRLAQPAYLVDAGRISGLDGIREAEDGGLRLGAMTRLRELERDPNIASRAPLLRLAVPYIAHPQIRNRSTVGGCLAHADPAAELPALAVALDARLRIRSTAGERWVAARDFFVGLLTTCLEPTEMVVEMALPRTPARTGWAFQEVARRHGDYAQVGLAAGLTLDDASRIARCRLVFLSAGDLPIEAKKACEALMGREPGEEVFAAAAETAQGEIDPSDDIHASAAFKRHLASVLTRRALSEAAARAREAA